MSISRRHQIRFRIWLAIMLTSGAVLIATFAVALVQQANYFKEYLQSNYISTAKIISANSSVAINFDDQVVVEELLNSMENDGNLQRVVVYDAQGNLFAQKEFAKQQNRHTLFSASAELDINSIKEIFAINDLRGHRSTEYKLAKNQLIIIDPVLFSDRYIGMVVLSISLAGIFGNMADYLITMMPVMAVIILGIFIVTRYVSTTITRPLYALLDGATKVKQSNDYSLRLPIINEDEVGVLTSEFNNMMAQVERREHELISHQDDLKEAVDERTSELQFATKNALASAEAAKNAMRARSDFLARVSHEIRTPINGVLGITELLNSTRLDEQQVSYVNAVYHSTKQLLGIVNDILDHSKIEAGNFQINVRPCYIKSIIESSFSTMRARAFEKNLMLNYELADTVLEPLIGDPNRVEQIINNLLGNAIKFSKNGEVNIKVCRDPEKQGCVYFSVTDHGIGIDADKQQLIFDSFMQADGSISREYGGTGLGLTICKDLVNIMGGEIGVHSVPGEGATFYFSIPMLQATAADKAAQEHTATANEERLEVTFATRPKILLVEDNQVNVIVGTGILEMLHCDVSCANDGKQAVALAKMHQYDLIMMDCHMPIMNGFEAAELIRQDSKCRDVPIVALTADVSEGIIERCRKAGMHDYMSKPYNKNTMAKLLKKIIIDGENAVYLTQDVNCIAQEQHTHEVLIMKCDNVEATNDHVDEKVLQEIHELGRGVNEHIVEQIIRAYLERTGEIIVSAHDALKNKNWQQLSDCAHNLKSCSGNVGANKLASLCGTLEAEACSASAAANELLVEQMIAEHQKVIAILTDKLT